MDAKSYLKQLMAPEVAGGHGLSLDDALRQIETEALKQGEPGRVALIQLLADPEVRALHDQQRIVAKEATRAAVVRAPRIKRQAVVRAEEQKRAAEALQAAKKAEAAAKKTASEEKKRKAEANRVAAQALVNALQSVGIVEEEDGEDEEEDGEGEEEDGEVGWGVCFLWGGGVGFFIRG